MPRSLALVTKLRAAGFAAFISGAGPTVLLLRTGNGSAEFEEYARASFQVSELAIARKGVEVL